MLDILSLYYLSAGHKPGGLRKMVQSLAKSKSLTLGTGGKLSKNALRELLQMFSGIVNNLLADVNKKMVDDNNF